MPDTAYPAGELALAEPAVAYLASVLPARSETFVYREIRALRARNHVVHAVSLRAPQVSPEDKLDDVCEGLTVVYGSEVLRDALQETLEHPRAALATLGQAALDAVLPGEPLALAPRLKLPAQAFAAVGLARRLRARGVKHVHCHFAHAPPSIGMYAAKHLGVPFSFTGHANDLFQRRALLKKKLERAAFVACISRWHRELYTQLSPSRADKYHVIRCGVDVARWRPRASRSTGERLEILTVCRLVHKKGVDTLISAIARLPRDARLTIAGDGPEQARLEALTRALGCERRVRFLGGVDNDTVRRLMQEEAHVFALPCRTDSSGDRDGVPVVLIEAMACSLPVISGDLPAIRELITHGEDGLLVPPDDSAALSEELSRLTDERREELGRAARSKVEREFSLDTTVERLGAALGLSWPVAS